MATPQEKLAESLETLSKLQERGVVAIRTADLSRSHRERLLKNTRLNLDSLKPQVIMILKFF